ncbi:S-layer homology domain-containing protein [Paenibacillus solisilvae]|uniref:S-layer homology domain-containing protein n=1 Tax=Paenibacillus solisilvae TaxID=2486751 RepID=A0ABW0VQE9_9BACL
MNKGNRHWLVTLCAAVALTAAMPGAAFADSAVPPGPSAGAGDLPAGSVKEGNPVDASVSKTKAEALARSYVSIPDDYKLQNVNLYNSMNGIDNIRNIWRLSFVKLVNGKQKGGIEVSIDADSGQLTSYQARVEEPNAKPSYPLKVNRDAARTVALSFIAKQSPGYKDQLRFDEDYGKDLKPPLNGQVVHSLRFDRLVGDIAYMDNYIDVDVDSEGRVLRYEINWNDKLVFTQTKPSLSLEEAAAKIQALAKPVLFYMTPYQMKAPRQPILGYSLAPITLDAVTGELAVSPNSASDQWETSPLADKPLGSKPQTGKALTREQAAQAIKDAFPIPQDAVQSDANYNEYKDDSSGVTSSSWNISWQLKDGNKEAGSIHASIDSDTGVIRSYSSYRFQENAADASAAKRITYEEAKTKAVELVKKQLPWLANQLFVRQPSEIEIERQNNGNNQYSIAINRIVDGARIDNDSIQVNIDAQTGDVREYWVNVSGVDYPAQTPPVISVKQAVDAWLNFYKLELTYVTETSFQINGEPVPAEKYKLMLASGELQGDAGDVDSKTKLVYRLVPKPMDESVLLDAQTRQWRSTETGDVTTLVKPKAMDVEGHWAQRELELMVAYKALDVADGKVRPNQIVTRGELIKMLVLAMNSGRPPIMYASDQAAADFADVSSSSAYYVYVQDAVQQNLIDIGDGSFNPEGKVNREEMAELIVRALGYNSLAEHDELFNTSFKDLKKVKQRGQAAIVVGLHIMSLTDGNFLPERQVTRAEASAAFFRFLTERAALKEAPLRND